MERTASAARQKQSVRRPLLHIAAVGFLCFRGGERRSLCGSIQRSELPACPKQPVLNGVGGEGGPGVRNEKVVFRQVVHDDRNAQHGGKRDKIRPGRTAGKPAPSVLPSATRRYRLLSAPTKVSSRRCPARPFARLLRQELPRSN